MTRPPYRGRFAPSPTGPLHFGSLVAAVASFADARHRQGEWLVRIEDIDETRSSATAERRILAGLAAFGMQSDRPPVRQSARKALYRQALERLVGVRQVYRCSCSRKTVVERGRPGVEGPIYPGTCRKTPPAANDPAAWRVTTPDQAVGFTDRVVGPVAHNLAQAIGDFVVQRIDGFTAYQLAVVVDDHEQGITDVVRGADLLWSTPRQVWLQRLLGYPTPNYAHIPLVYGSDGHKLSKRDNAHPVLENDPVHSLRAAWLHLGQSPTPKFDSVAAFWTWAVPRWNIHTVPRDANERHERSDAL